MSQNPQPDRLDSLTRGSIKPSAKPGLKFKPKVVARRSKEERDASAPTIEADPTNRNHKATRGGRGGARGGRGGGRGGKHLAGTHVVQAGPLASGNAIGESSGGNHRGVVRGVTPEYLSSLGRKSESAGPSSRAASLGVESDDDDESNNFSKIDMSKEYKFESVDVELFPVRASRAHYGGEDVKKEGESRESSPEIIQEDILIREDSPVKEESEKDLQTILKEKSNQLQTKLESLHLDPNSLDDQFGALEDELRTKQDHKEILQHLVDLNNHEEKFLFVQLPHVLPEFQDPALIAAQQSQAKAQLQAQQQQQQQPIEVKPELDNTTSLPQQTKGLSGQIGHLRVHKSGKLTLKIGEVVMDVGKGSQGTFLQQVVLVDHSEEKPESDDQGESIGSGKGMRLLGHVAAKVDVIPRFE